MEGPPVQEIPQLWNDVSLTWEEAGGVILFEAGVRSLDSRFRDPNIPTPKMDDTTDEQTAAAANVDLILKRIQQIQEELERKKKHEEEVPLDIDTLFSPDSVGTTSESPTTHPHSTSITSIFNTDGDGRTKRQRSECDDGGRPNKSGQQTEETGEELTVTP